MPLLVFLLLISYSVQGWAAPANSTRIDTAGWVSNPNGRGTLDIILSCLLTLVLCVWSAVHLNIPKKNESHLSYVLRNTQWVILGILIPELVVLAAWRQWSSGRRMKGKIQKIVQDEEENNSYMRKERMNSDASRSSFQKKHEWTIVHSYYAGMGGFAFDVDASLDVSTAFIPKQNRLTLTCQGVLLLAECGLLPDIDIEDIKDKSKADGISKALVCLQVSWMVLQTLGRISMNQPITLLEVNTLGHVFCALIIYILWWNKPREVHEPTILQGHWVEPMCAYMYMSSRVSGRKPNTWVNLRSWVKPELADMVWFPEECHSSDESDNPKNNALGTMELVEVEPTDTEEKLPISGHLGPLPRGIELRRMTQWDKFRDDSALIDGDSPEMKRNRLELASKALRATPGLLPSVESMAESQPLSKFQILELQQLVVPVADNFPSDYYLPGLGSEIMGMTLWFASMAYGGVHVAAWHEFFPSPTEQILWRISSVYIACSGMLWFLFNLIGFVFPWAEQYWERFVSLKALWIEYLLIGSIATCCGLLYLFSRVFLVVEAVVSLRVLPITVYNTPNWSSMIPHL